MNYALLRRDLEELQKFRAVILDEAQFIMNPGASGHDKGAGEADCPSHRSAHRHTAGKSHVGFVEHRGLYPPGSQEDFIETYEPRGANAANSASPASGFPPGYDRCCCAA